MLELALDDEPLPDPLELSVASKAGAVDPAGTLLLPGGLPTTIAAGLFGL